MNTLIFFGLIIELVLRIVGLGIAIEVLANIKKKRSIPITIGWLIWIITTGLPIFLAIILKKEITNIFITLNASLSAFALIMILLGFISYFYPISRSLFILLVFIQLIIPISSFIVFGQLTYKIISALLIFIIYSLFLLIIVIYRKNAISIIGSAIKWLYVSLIVVISYLAVSIIQAMTVNNFSFGLYRSTDEVAIIINYSFSILLNIMMIVLLLHFERGLLNKEKTKIIDTYSHSLGNIIQVILGTNSLIVSQMEADEGLRYKSRKIQEKCDEAVEIIDEIRKL